MSLKLRVRKDPTASHPLVRWRVEVAANPVGAGPSVGWSSWVDAMVAAREIRNDAAAQLADFYTAASK